MYNLISSDTAFFTFYLFSESCKNFKEILPIYGGALGVTIFGLGLFISEANRVEEFMIEISDRERKKMQKKS